MSNMTQYDYNEKNIELSGKGWHEMKLAEEAAELSAAILQVANKGVKLDKILKEIADVEIAINYFRMIYQDRNKDIEYYKKLKYKKINTRVRKMMKENKNRNER